MADQEITVSMDDKELFDSAIAEEPKPEPVREEAVTESERQRDELGRFAAKQEAKPETAPGVAPTQQQAPGTEQKDDQAGQVPSWRLREVSEARQAAERRADEASRQTGTLQAQLQAMERQLTELRTPKKEPVDFFSNPDEAIQDRLSPIQAEMAQFKADLRLEMSRELAVVKHGEPLVAEMEKAIAVAMSQNHPDMPSLAAKMRTSNNPASVALQWYKNSKLLDETGGDLAAYRQKILDEAMKDPEFQGKVLEASRTTAGQHQPGTRPNIQLPPSLNKAAGSAGIQSTALDDNDMSDAGLFQHAVSSPRRR